MDFNEKLCEEKHSHVKEKFEVVDRRLNNHADRIDTIEKANIKLTEILERVTTPTKISFWNTKAGQVIPIVVCIVIVTTILGLVGANIIEIYKEIPKVLPK